MSNIVRLKTQTQIDNEAAVWTWRLDCGTLSDVERGELETWLREDPRHRRTFEELRLTWGALDRLAERAWDTSPQEAELAAPRRSLLAALRPSVRGRRAYWESAAAAVLVVALGAALWIGRRPRMQVVATTVGQHRQMTLADGTRLTLNTDTLLEIKLTAQRRDIYLRRGEAHFGVVHDAARPFFVHVGDAVVRDVGTQFEVRLHSDRDIDVLVDEGQVEVRGPASAAAPGVTGVRRGGNAWVRAVTAGEQLFIAGPSLKVTSVSPKQVADDLAWREGALVFDGEPLSQALAEVGRYTRTRIVLRGSAVAALRISGRFRTDDLPGFFRALQTALPVQVSRPGPDLVYVAAR